MSTQFSPRVAMLVAAGVVALAGCAGEPTTAVRSASAPSVPNTPSFLVGDIPLNAVPEPAKIKVCKSASSNVSGDFTITRLGINGSVGTVLPLATVAPGACVVVAEDNGLSGIGSDVTITETSAGLTGITAEMKSINTGVTTEPFSNGGTIFVNSFHGWTITFTNVVQAPPPPPAVCDFITFGRLVTTLNNKKVVISGNAGGNKPGGGILGEFHIDANGVDNHVADIATYGPIASGPLSGLTNSRMVTGKAKNGVDVELRLWDGGEPGKNTDVVYVKLNGVVTLNAIGQTIDQGNMQYHPNCRGPK